VAADVVEDDAAAASAATGEVQRAGRDALDEIGRLLRLIRDGGDASDAQPQHGVADVPALAEEYVRAGLEVDLDMDGVSSLPMGVDLSAYRVVQEGLTNALKHAPGSAVRVRLAQCGRDVAIEVRNGPSFEVGRAAALESGHGLTGLLERVTLFGGHLEARPTDDGGFVLAATMPLTSEAR
jgi:signal transduction histidine kinase